MTQSVFQAQPFELPFDSRTTALVMINMQYDSVEAGGFGEALGNDVSLVHTAITPCTEVLTATCQKGTMVTHTREGHRAGLSNCPPAKLTHDGRTFIGEPGPMGRILIRGEAGHNIIPELYPVAGEPVIDKPGKGAFYQTNLHLTLRNHGIKTLIVCGITTEVCVITTVREASDRGYECIIPKDCVGSYFPELQKYALEMIKTQGAIFGWVTDPKAITTGLEG